MAAMLENTAGIKPAAHQGFESKMDTSANGGHPTHVGRFEICEILRTGPPRLFRGYDPRTERDVTIEPWPSAEDEQVHVGRLIRRHHAQMELRHPTIVPIYEFGHADGHCYAVGAFADGRLLSQALEEGPFSVRRAAVVTLALVEGLDYAHEHGFVHGAVEPDHVTLTENGGAVWQDFGVHADQPPDNPAYTAPERLGDPPGPADTASDQYGVGALLYGMITGVPPYDGDPDEVTARLLAADTAPSPRAERPDVPKDLDAICRRAMAPHPAERYRTCSELADDLRRWLDGMPVAARRRLRAPGPVWTAALLLLSILTGAAVIIAGIQVRVSRQALAAERAARDAAVHAMQVAEQSEYQRNVARDSSEASRADAEARNAAEAKARAQAEKQRDTERNKVFALEAKIRSEKTKAEDERKDVTNERDRFERVIYDQLVAQSQRAWRDHDPGRARALLAGARPRDKRRDLRDWEWFYLERLFRPPETFTFKPEPSRITGTEPRAADGTDLRRACCAYDPGGGFLAVSILDDRITVLNTTVGGAALTVEGHEGAVCDVVFSPDGKLLASAGADKVVHLWDPGTGQSVRELKGHHDAVLAIAFGPDSQTVATAGADRTAIVWETAGAKLHTLKGHEAAVLDLAFSPDGRTLATSDANGVVRLWDVKSGDFKTTIVAHLGAATCVAFAPDGGRIATGGEDRLVKIWDATSGQEERVLSGPAKAVRTLAFRADGQRLAAAGDDLTVSQWDLPGGRFAAFSAGHTASIHRVAYRSDGKQMATASTDGSLKLWDPDRPTGENDVSFRQDDSVLALATSPDGRRLATGGQDKSIRIWDARSRNLIRTLTGHSGPVRAVALSADGNSLLSGSDDKTAKIWDAASGQVQQTLTGHDGAVLAVTFSPDGKKLATGSKDGTVRVRETATGQSLITLRRHGAAVVAVQFSADGKRLLSSGADGSARSWDVADAGRELATVTDRVDNGLVTLPPGARRRDSLALPGAYPARAIYKPDGKQVAFACRDGSILVYDTTSVLPRMFLEGHDGLIRCMAYSPDGGRLVSGDSEGVVKMWDTRTGLEVLSLAAHDGAVNGLTFGPGGQILYTASADRTIKAWDGSPLDGKKPARKEEKEEE
jgi:WD40 repeat protein